MGAIIPPKLPFANLAKEVACYFVSPLPTLGKAYQTIIFPIEYPQIKDLTQCESKQYLYSKRKATLYSWDTGQTMKLPTIQTIRLGNLRPDLACYLEICFITLTRMLRLRMRHTTAPLLEKNGKKYSNCPNQCPAEQINHNFKIFSFLF